MQLTFEDFQMADSINCDEDYLEIREANSTGKLLGVYCDQNIPSNISHSNSLWLLFSSSERLKGDIVNTGKGFLAHYSLGFYIFFYYNQKKLKL